MQKETVWRRMEDEIEYMRIGCDKLARADKATSEHLGSLENQIATLGSESAVRLGALESQMSSITATLARIEASSVINQRPGKGIASSSMDHHDQKETVWRQMEDEIEYMRIGCDKLARADKATSERLGSLENQIATMGSESAVRLGALEISLQSKAAINHG
ncbi:hypothetical protein F2Q68_00001311 [Brassica cretica]|uniref:Uncharacterized protein n=1 Tax=Brassica cretica TaxID=69181 RepID=A0A8S9JBI0_BRACR|nr:hypothetical protein F2Q68_00001311 [Brassica cretica]